MRFSERMGYKKPKTEIQHESMDNDLKNRIWSLIYLTYCQNMERFDPMDEEYYEIYQLFQIIWFSFFKKPIDEMPEYGIPLLHKVKSLFYQFSWYEVYDFTEFIVDNFGRGLME